MEIVLILCPFSEMDRKCAYAKACISGNVEALLKLRALCKYLLGRILLVGLPKIAVTADCNAGYGIYKWIVHSILSQLFLLRAWDAKAVSCQPP